MWWHNGYVNSIAAKELANYPNLKRTLYIGGRSGNIFKAFGIYDMDSILKAKAPQNLKWKTTANADEHHGSVRLKNIYDDLKFTYFGYAPFILDFYPANGILLKDKPVNIHIYSTYLDYDPGIRYTTDGTVPTPASARFDDNIQVTAPADLTLKLFSTRDTDRMVKGHFILGQTLPPVAKPKIARPGGLHYNYYAGNWGKMPDFKKLKPTQLGRADADFALNKFGKNGFACLISGYIEIKRDGYYTFFFDATEDASLYLGNYLLINPKLISWNTEAKSFIVPLKQGFYPVRIEYLHHTQDPVFILMYQKPGNGYLATLPLNIPYELLYSN